MEGSSTQGPCVWQLDAEITAQEALGRDLRVARESARLTQPRLAEIAAVQQAEISRIERGLGNPTRDMLLKLAGALNLRLTLAPVAPRATSGAHTV